MASIFGSVGNIADTYFLYTFIRRMATKFENWPAFKVGLIDKEGKFLVSKDQRTPEQNKSMSYMDLMVLNLKRLLGKIPYGDSKIATFAGALFLLREGHKERTEEEINKIILEFDYRAYYEEARLMLEDASVAAGGVAANNIGDGKIAPKNDKSTLLLKRKEKKIITR